MWSSSEKQDTLSTQGEAFGKLIAARFGDLLALHTRSAFLCLVDNHEIPGNLL